MSSFLKSIFHSSNKHKKLCEDWAINRELVVDGSTFCVRYLGSSLVEDPKSAQSTAAGVKRVIQAAKAKARRPEKVFFRVAMEGVRIDLTSTGEILMDTSIYKISYCSADSHYEQVLAFVASNEDESCECHAFLCSKRKEAQEIAVTISHAFAMAYECWKQAIEAKENGRSALTAEQMAGRGGESPPRLSKGGECSNSSRASSPEHSPGHSSPHSVSSTSGYLSSTPGSLLLELDYTDAGSDGALAPQLQDPSSGPSRCRKHWTSFDDVSDLADDFLRLSSGPAMSSCPLVHRTDPLATEFCSFRPEWPEGSRTPLTPPAAVGITEGGTAKVPPPSDPAAIAPSTAITAAAATLSLTQSRNNCLLPPTREQHKRPPPTPQPAGGSCDRTVLPPRVTAQTDPVAFLRFPTKRQNRSDFLTNPTNPINLPDAKYTNLANTTDFNLRSEYIVNRLSEDSGILHTTCSSKLAHFGPTNNLSTGGERDMSMEGADVDAWQSGAAMAFCLIDRGISVPRDRWESFDSSPSPTSPASTFTSVSTMSPSPSVAFGSFTITIPKSSASIASISSKLSSSSSPCRPLSPNTAFLDSCLTPRPEEDDSKGPRFAFIGRLSGEGRIFTNTPNATPIQALCSQNQSSKRPNFQNNSNGNSALGNGSIGRTDLAGRKLQNFSRNSDSFSPQSPPPEAVR